MNPSLRNGYVRTYVRTYIRTFGADKKRVRDKGRDRGTETSGEKQMQWPRGRNSDRGEKRLSERNEDKTSLAAYQYVRTYVRT